MFLVATPEGKTQRPLWGSWPTYWKSVWCVPQSSMCVCVCVCVCVCGWVGAFTSTSLVADDFAAILSPLHCHRSRRSSSNGPSPAATVSSVGGGASLDWPVPSTAQRKAASKSSSDRVGGAKHKTPSNAESISNSPIRFQFISASFPNHFRIHFPVSFQFALYLFSKGAVSLRPKKNNPKDIKQ